MVSYRLSIRKVERSDIPYLVEWANNHSHVKGFNGYLPKNINEGNKWFQRSLLDKTRDDYVIYVFEEGGKSYPIGMLGLINIDDVNRKGEYYIIIGNEEFLHRGIAYRTTNEMVKNTYFKNFDFVKVYARIDKENYPAQKLAEKLGFRKEGVMLSDILLENGTPVDRIYYGLLASDKQ
ncbi:MAG: GNAT family N-acetyltransferase [Clostridia bacterium]|nr:GNAT family N-acetyltransferase [Clostridia bacterium]